MLRPCRATPCIVLYHPPTIVALALYYNQVIFYRHFPLRVYYTEVICYNQYTHTIIKSLFITIFPCTIMKLYTVINIPILKLSQSNSTRIKIGTHCRVLQFWRQSSPPPPKLWRHRPDLFFFCVLARNARFILVWECYTNYWYVVF